MSRLKGRMDRVEKQAEPGAGEILVVETDSWQDVSDERLFGYNGEALTLDEIHRRVPKNVKVLSVAIDWGDEESVADPVTAV